MRFTTSTKISITCDCEYHNRFIFTVRFRNTSSLNGTLTSDASIGDSTTSEGIWAYQYIVHNVPYFQYPRSLNWDYSLFENIFK